MNRLLFLSLFVVASGCSSTPEKKQPGPSPIYRDVPVNARDNRGEEPRKRILVLPFVDISGDRTEKVSESARQAFLKSLSATKAFVIVQNSDFPKDPKTLKVNDQYDLETISKIAGGMGIALVMEGRILEIKARRLGDQVGLVRKIRARMEAKIQLRIYATKQGREVINEIREANIEDTTTRIGSYAYSDKFLEEDPELIDSVVQKAFRGVVNSIMAVSRKISWEGRIAMVTGDRIYVNAGRLSGLQVGDILRINDEGQDVFDPENGALIGKAPGKMKGTVEVISYFGQDGAIGVIHSGSGFRESDQVEFY